MRSDRMISEKQATRKGAITIRDFLKLPNYFIRGIRYHAAGRFYTPKPTWATFNVTHRCNARCIMCSDAIVSAKQRGDNDNELTLTEMRQIFGNSLFKSVKHFALSGGEPTQREDLVEITRTVLDVCPGIRELTLFTNGLEPDRIVDVVERIMALPESEMLNRFTVSVSLDGCGDIHQQIRRFPRAFDRATETIKRLQGLRQKIPLHICSTCVVQQLNHNNLSQLREFAEELGLPVSFIPVWIPDTFGDEALRATITFTGQDSDRVKNIMSNEMPGMAISNVISWQEYFRVVGGEKRKLPCFLLDYYAGVDSDGMIYNCYSYCPTGLGNARDEPPDKIWYSERARETRERLRKHVCPQCNICCNTAFSLQEEFFYAARFLLKEKVRKLSGK